MPKVIYNKKLTDDMYLLKVAGQYEGRMGQFYMVRAWDRVPVLSRPISIHDIDDEGITFLYRVVGQGTKIMQKLESGMEVKLEGPYGNGFPSFEGKKIALVGGGMGVAPLYLAAKELNDKNRVDVYLGFRSERILEDEYERASNSLHINIGGKVGDIVPYEEYDYVFTCGPSKMMEAVNMQAKGKSTVYVSLEKRMACGVGACLVCTCATKGGNKKTCKDGPVFLGEEVEDYE